MTSTSSSLPEPIPGTGDFIIYGDELWGREAGYSDICQGYGRG